VPHSSISNSLIDHDAINSWESEGGRLDHLPQIQTVASHSAFPAGRYKKLRNDNGISEIKIGMKEFECIGISPPHDHPHVYLDMGAAEAILCPYCATLFSYDSRLAPFEVDPPECSIADPVGN